MKKWENGVFFRTLKDEEKVKKKDERNTLAKYLAIEHPEEQGDIGHFNIQVHSTYMNPLEREKKGAVKLQTSKADYILNSKSEHKQPRLHRVVMTRDNDVPGARRGRGGHGGPGRRGSQGAALRSQGSS